jgi:predicted nucleic acid-binding protein
MAGELEFVDTNVHVYAADLEAGTKRTQALALVNRLWTEQVGATSLQVLHELQNVLSRKVHRPLSPRDALERVEPLSAWALHRPDVADLRQVVALQTKHKLSFWDAMIVNSALELGCTILWSEDLQTGRLFGALTIRSPFSVG